MIVGEVFSWGDNDEGQLGDGTTNAIQRPRLVASLLGLNIIFLNNFFFYFSLTLYASVPSSNMKEKNKKKIPVKRPVFLL